MFNDLVIHNTLVTNCCRNAAGRPKFNNLYPFGFCFSFNFEWNYCNDREIIRLEHRQFQYFQFVIFLTGALPFWLNVIRMYVLRSIFKLFKQTVRYEWRYLTTQLHWFIAVKLSDNVAYSNFFFLVKRWCYLIVPLVCYSSIYIIFRVFDPGNWNNAIEKSSEWE